MKCFFVLRGVKVMLLLFIDDRLFVKPPRQKFFEFLPPSEEENSSLSIVAFIIPCIEIEDKNFCG